jgi:hypothetical protein
MRISRFSVNPIPVEAARNGPSQLLRDSGFENASELRSAFGRFCRE